MAGPNSNETNPGLFPLDSWVVVDSTLLVNPQSSWTGLDPDFDEKPPGNYFLHSGSDHPDFRRHCLIFWSQVLPHILVPGTASYPGPRYCLIFRSQGLLHFLVPSTASYLVPGTASFSGPRYCLMQGPKNLNKKRGPNWTRHNDFNLKLGPNESNHDFAQS